MNPEARETLRRLAEQALRDKPIQADWVAVPPAVVLALLDAIAAREWRDIETAPKDTWLLCWNGSNVALLWNDNRIGWQNQRGHSILTPTHWQHLPPSPSPEEK